MVTTSKDFVRNLRESVKSYVKAGGPCRTVVFATSRAVTGKRRLDLVKELSRRWSVELRYVHDRSEFVRLLYETPRWRKELLGIEGSARALSQFPIHRRPTPAISLVGRDEDLERLRQATGDLVVVGKPGVGKTFLLDQLASEGWCLFDTDRAVADLPDAIREMGPKRIVVDDAHLAGESRILEIPASSDGDVRRLRYRGCDLAGSGRRRKCAA